MRVALLWARSASGRGRRTASRTASLICFMAFCGAGCSVAERSRALGDPLLSARTIAAQVCVNCHGLTGNPVSPAFPMLAGQQKTYLEAQLKAFRNRSRAEPAASQYMWGMSAGLSDVQIAGLAAYYAAQKPAPRATDPAPIRATGQAIYEQGLVMQGVPACIGCHGAAGRGTKQFPRLAGQNADYLGKQLHIFRDTDYRREGSMMKGAAMALSDDDIAAVAAYLEHQSEP